MGRSWVVSRGSWVVSRGSWVVGRGSWDVCSEIAQKFGCSHDTAFSCFPTVDQSFFSFS